MQETKETDIENNCERVKPAGYPTKRLQKLCEFSSVRKRALWLPQKGHLNLDTGCLISRTPGEVI